HTHDHQGGCTRSPAPPSVSTLVRQLMAAAVLIREDDANVFIAECKIFGPKDGPSRITATIDQLLGYLTWRDTKAALLLFIRDRDVTTVIAKAVAAFESHPNFKRRGKTSTEERHDFILHTNGDPSREMIVAFLPFLVGSGQ
ncbi:hypothetical protein ACFWC0_31085, partial [Micromonospora chalcea]